MILIVMAVSHCGTAAGVNTSRYSWIICTWRSCGFLLCFPFSWDWYIRPPGEIIQYRCLNVFVLQSVNCPPVYRSLRALWRPCSRSCWWTSSALLIFMATQTPADELTLFGCFCAGRGSWWFDLLYVSVSCHFSSLWGFMSEFMATSQSFPLFRSSKVSF